MLADPHSKKRSRDTNEYNADTNVQEPVKKQIKPQPTSKQVRPSGNVPVTSMERLDYAIASRKNKPRGWSIGGRKRTQRKRSIKKYGKRRTRKTKRKTRRRKTKRTRKQRGGNPPKKEIISVADLGTPDPPRNRKKLKESDEFEVRWDKIYTPLKVQPTELKDPEKKEKYGNIGINWGENIHRPPPPPPQPGKMRRTTSLDDINYYLSDSSGGSSSNKNKKQLSLDVVPNLYVPKDNQNEYKVENPNAPPGTLGNMAQIRGPHPNTPTPTFNTVKGMFE